MFCPGLKIKFLVVNLEPILTRVLKKIPKKEDPPAHDLFLLLSLLPLLFLLEAGKAEQWDMGGGGSRKRGWVVHCHVRTCSLSSFGSTGPPGNL